VSALTYTRFPSPQSRRIHLGRWVWAITDGLTGPAIISGRAISEWGALRKIERAVGRCEQRVDCDARHPLTRSEALQICACLAVEGIRITIKLSEAVDVYAVGPVDTRQEVAALGAVLARTDAPVRWHAGVTS
jgi:hypothetical protein